MALRAGYYGLKRSLKDKLFNLAASTPKDISPDNPIVSWSDVGKYVGKNRFPITLAQLKVYNPSGTWSGNVWSIGTMTITVSTDSNGYIEELDFNGSDSNTLFIILLPNTSDNKYAGMILNGCPASGSGSTYQIISRIGKISGDTYISSAEDNGSGATIGTISDTSTDQMRIYIRIQADYLCNHLKLKPMIRHVGLSADFESYIPDNTELTEMLDGKVDKEPLTLSNTDDIDNIWAVGDDYCWGGSIPLHAPENHGYCSMRVIKATSTLFKQIIYYGQNIIYMREKNGDTINSFYKFEGTEVTSPSPTPENETKKATKKKVIKEEE